jgi:FkbM family methyltransferase
MLKKWYADGGDYALRFNYNLTPKSLVLDIGGYEGQWASDIYSRYCCKVIVFEPVKEFAERIRKRFSKNPDISVLQFGLGKVSRIETIGICSDGSSISKVSNQNERIQIVDVADYITSQNISKIDLMKVNVEGAEYELLERLIETDLCRIISNIQVQFHNISKESSDRMERIQKCLRDTHYATYQYRFLWENWVRNDV